MTLDEVVSSFRVILNEIKTKENHWNGLTEAGDELNVPMEDLTKLVDRHLEYVDCVELKMANVEKNCFRSQTKIYLFGVVDAGKTAVVNALLGADLFKVTTASATSCIVKIRPAQKLKIKYESDGEGVEEMFETIDVLRGKLDELTNMENYRCLRADKGLSLYWDGIIAEQPINFDMELIDVPGISGEATTAKKVEEKCIDANAFVFVVSKMPGEEEQMFIKNHIKRSSQPEIFILVNKWDTTDCENQSLMLKRKGETRDACVRFLIDSCHISRAGAEEKIFFVSAKEMLQLRMKTIEETELSNKQKERLSEFRRFEEALTEYGTRSANKCREEAEHEYDLIRADVNREIEKFQNDFEKIRADLQPSRCDGIIWIIDESMSAIVAHAKTALDAILHTIPKKAFIFENDQLIQLEGFAWIAQMASVGTHNEEGSAEEDAIKFLQELDSYIRNDVNQLIGGTDSRCGQISGQDWTLNAVAPSFARDISHTAFRQQRIDTLSKEIDDVVKKILKHYLDILSEKRDIYVQKRNFLESLQAVNVKTF